LGGKRKAFVFITQLLRADGFCGAAPR